MRRRITLAFVLLALLLSSFFSLVSYVSVEVIESQVVDERLAKMAGQLIARHRMGLAQELPPEVSFFANGDIPAPLRTAPPGVHEAVLDQREAQALIIEDGADRYALVQDMEEFEHTEFIIFSALAVGSAASLALALLLGVATARRLASPLVRLADAVERDTPPHALPSQAAGDEVGVLARAFARRTEALQQYLARERVFTGDVSHELRTPLTVVLGAAEVLKSRLADRPIELAAAERIRRAAADATARIAGLLQLSRAPESLDPLPTEMLGVVRAELERCQYLLAGKAVDCALDFTGPVTVAARPELAGIVVGNLLRNACQHTEQGRIRISLSPTRLIIEDSGPGIPEAVRNRLFERFVHGDAGPDAGAGLGLSIVKRVADHLGWEVWLEGCESGGSRFIVGFTPASRANQGGCPVGRQGQDSWTSSP
ncbi:MAG: sensor histidine kinase [Noviherbaspirillum sp.]